MTLYNLKSADGDWRITKFTNELDPEGSYLVSADACTCPAGVRPTCRHRQMLPKFLAAEAEDSGMFFHFETEQFLTPDLGESNSSSDLSETDDSSTDSEVEFAENVSAEFHGEILEPNAVVNMEDFGRELMAKDITPTAELLSLPQYNDVILNEVESIDNQYGISPIISSGELDLIKSANTERSNELKSIHPQGTIRRRL